MSTSGQELEVKFYLRDLPALRARLEGLGAHLVQERVHEINLRFDTPGSTLINSGRLLRLRQDNQAHITYKGPGSVQDGARLRQELEFTVGDFAMAQAVIEALGYQVVLMYEKYRAAYQGAPGQPLSEVLVTLDEMPYGYFAEIEGPDGPSIQVAAAQLGLDWEARILDSYTVLFEQARQALGLGFRDLSFENFKGIEVPPEALGVRAADDGLFNYLERRSL
jgi:adenylate cyclase class 2